MKSWKQEAKSCKLMLGMIQKIVEKIKTLPRIVWSDIFLIGIILLVSLASFGLGRLSVFYGDKEGVKILYPENQSGAVYESLGKSRTEGMAEEEVPLPSPLGQYVASKTGSKYHFPWCSGAQSIKEENKIYFDSKEAAEKAGYTPAANCKGL